MRLTPNSGGCRQLHHAYTNTLHRMRTSRSFCHTIRRRDPTSAVSGGSSREPRTEQDGGSRKGKRGNAPRDQQQTEQFTLHRRLYQKLGIAEGHPLAGPLDTPSTALRPPVLKDGKLKWKSGSGDDRDVVDIPARWVRDVCACSECRHPDTAQRQINVLRGDPARTKIVEADSSQWPQHLSVTFEDGHRTVVPGSTILHRQSLTARRNREGIVPVVTWTSSIRNDPPTVQYEDIQAGTGMGPLLSKVRTHGFAFVDNMPATPEATEALLQTIGPIRNTHYGAFYDFTSDLSSKDTAYTSEALDPHTDNTYFTEPAGLQALHMLSHTDGSGGESSLVDGFAAAERLYREDPAAYLMLSKIGIYAHASGNAGISIQPSQAFPTLTHSRQNGTLMQVRWNNADRAGVAVSWRHLDAWYDAAAALEKLLNDPGNQYWFRLKPGRMLLFDNWRVLHGRAAFTGKRRMCGGYINRDDFISRFRMTNYAKEEVERFTVTG